MRIETFICPTCGARVYGILETITVTAVLMDIEKDGVTDYCGESKMHWDTQQPCQGVNGNFTVVCNNGHEYQSIINWNEEEADGS